VQGTKDKEPNMADTPKCSIAFVGIDIGKTSFDVVGLNDVICCGRSGDAKVPSCDLAAGLRWGIVWNLFYSHPL
jgi:hypothetical protein